MTQPIRLRRSIWGLESHGPWDPYSLAYARAVVAMQKLPESDVLSWDFQAGIHGRLCQHQTWFFLPWHRMYILWFERIVQAQVATQEDAPEDWALPYWDWQANRVIPPAFRERDLPDGEGPNPLFVEERNQGINDGAAMRPAVVDSNAADNAPAFSGGSTSGFGFGGGDTHGPSHFDGGQTGLIEGQPHNNVHRTIGGIMGTALSSLDPIFWLHHAQVDRLWEKWLAGPGGHRNPDAPGWLGQKYEFFDPDGNEVAQTPGEVLSTAALGYRYEDQPAPVALPLTAIVPELADATLLRLSGVVGSGDNPQELGASGPLRLGDGATTESIRLDADKSAGLERLAVPETGPRSVALVMEDIEPKDPATPSYEVYVNVPEKIESGHHDSRHFVGFLEFFGADHSHGDAEGHGHGLKRVFDITSLVQQLEQKGVWDPAKLEVSFVPASVLEDPTTGRALPPPEMKDASVKVGSVRVVSE
jgi:tyrosinase